ncbi:MAG: 3-hydroxyacyl-CoA dehydrogenase family protein [Candidatus Kariarchaeaceae archaeon]|jgi:3-hydroxybutyryl-CoA dehydrogenase
MTSIKKIAVIGSGQMGAGIGLLSASYGYEVVFNDIKQEFIEGGLNNNKKWLDRQVSKGKMDQAKADEIYGRMSGELSLEKSVSDVDLVIEAIIENMDIKKATWEKIGNSAPENTIFGSNTSSLSITEMAKASGRPDKFVGIHFFNPPIILKIIEYIKGYETADETLQTVVEYGKSMEMNTVTANESPGFIVNRLMIPQLNEAYYALQEGIASKEDIDSAMKFGLNHPMGPLTLSDFIGLDTILFITEYLHSELGEKFKPCPLLRKMVRAGKLGRKTGEGFYTY